MHPALEAYFAKYSDVFKAGNPAMRPWMQQLVQQKELASALKHAGSQHGGSMIDCAVPYQIARSDYEAAQKRKPQEDAELAKKEKIFRAMKRASEHGLLEQWRIWQIIAPPANYYGSPLSDLFKSERRVRAGYVRHQVNLGLTHSAAKSRHGRIHARRDQLARSILIWNRV